LKVMQRRLKNWTAKKVKYAIRKAEGLYQAWPIKRRRWVGAILLELVLDNCTWFTCAKRYRKNKKWSAQVIELQDGLRSALAQETEALEILYPFYYPMVVPPGDWAFGTPGGYRYHRLPLVKSHTTMASGTEHELQHGPAVYQAINAVQKTPWRINRKVLAVMEQCWKANTGKWPEIPLQNELPHHRTLVPYPEYGTEDEKKTWRQQAAQVYEHNISLTISRYQFLSNRMIAWKFYKQGAIYFPHQADFRGRIYPVPHPLQPQGSDLSRGLLEFADGKELGIDGFDWLLIHLANCFGVDKVDMRGRINWCWERLDKIVATAVDPFSDSWWAEADKPWQALACIFEIKASIDSPDYRSHLPVSVDGSNSGLQHFSAMLRDPEGARLTNLLPSPVPQDIYSLMAGWVNQVVEEDCARLVTTDDPLTLQTACKWWQGRINRKTLKRGTMTYVYGVTQQGIENYLMSDRFTEGMPNPYYAAKYLRRIIWKALQENVKGAATVMEWLRIVAKAGNEKNIPIRWVTPAGFVAVQEYLETDMVVIRTLERSIRYRVPRPEKQVNAYKQKNSLPPNFVHGQDAAHLILTVVACMAVGITHFAMIHDCYGTHAADVSLLNVVLREEFIKMYSGNVLEQFKAQVEAQLGVTVPDPPELGSFDIRLVRDSEFFFA